MECVTTNMGPTINSLNDSNRKFSIAIENFNKNKKNANKPLKAYLMYINNKSRNDLNSTSLDTKGFNSKLKRSNSCPISMVSQKAKKNVTPPTDGELPSSSEESLSDENDCDGTERNDKSYDDLTLVSKKNKAFKDNELLPGVFKIHDNENNQNYFITSANNEHYCTPPMSPRTSLYKVGNQKSGVNQNDFQSAAPQNCNSSNLCSRHHHRRSSVALKFQNPRRLNSWDDVDSLDSKQADDANGCSKPSEHEGFAIHTNHGINSKADGILFKDNFTFGD